MRKTLWQKTIERASRPINEAMLGPLVWGVNKRKTVIACHVASLANGFLSAFWMGLKTFANEPALVAVELCQ